MQNEYVCEKVRKAPSPTGNASSKPTQANNYAVHVSDEAVCSVAQIERHEAEHSSKSHI